MRRSAFARCRLLPILPPILSLLLLLPLAACTTAPKTAGAAAPPADDNLNAVLWMQTSAEYAAVTHSLYRAAGARLDAALADPDWNALAADDRAAAAAGKPPAIIVDVDETVLDNSPYQARLVRDGREFADETWDAWVAEARARAVPGAVAFAQAAAGKGVTLIYLSNREERREAETLANLRAAGFPVQSNDVFLGAGADVPGCVSPSGSDKSCRRRWVAARYRVLMQFGDQLGDFVRIPANTADARAALAAEYVDWFGERWWMLPNPTYGSWEPALFDNGWDQPRSERRQRKREALRTAD